jgi:hypothetical protein
MHLSHTNSIVLITLLAIGIIHADPVLFIKNNSDRAIHIKPIDQGRQPLAQAQFVKPKGEYKEESVDANDVKGVDIKYCQKGVSCATTDDVRTKGTVTRFEFNDPSATKFYLKLDIDKNDKISLERQEGRLGRTSNLKWSLDGNINQDTISKPRSIGAAPTDMPAPLFSSASKVGTSTPTTPLMEQPSMTTKLDSGALMVKKRLNEINTELKKIQQTAASKSIGRSGLEFIEKGFDTITKKYKDLKGEIAREEYQFTADEEILAQEADEKSAALTRTITKLKEILRTSPESTLSSATRKARTTTPITVEERQLVLQAIKTLAPALYNLIVQVDPKGENHIDRHYGLGAMVTPSHITGLPVIYVDSNVSNWPQGELLFTLGHELSHYILGHAFEEYHADYASENLLKKARNRIRESECDRMSILEFGNNIDDGIATVRHWMIEQRDADEQSPQKATFRRTHPLNEDRIKQLESLRQEVEIQKGRKRTPIDWNKLAQEHKETIQLQPVDSSLVQRYVNKTYTQADLDRFIDKVKLKYQGQNQGQIQYFALSDKNERGKPWTPDTIAYFLTGCLEDVSEAIKQRHFAKDPENRFIDDVLHTYYNAKLFAVKFQDNQEIKALIKGTLEELLNKEIAGNTIVNIIQKFEQ